MSPFMNYEIKPIGKGIEFINLDTLVHKWGKESWGTGIKTLRFRQELIRLGN